MLLAINCDVTKVITNFIVDFSFIHKKWQKNLVTLKDLFYSILLQDVVIEKICILLQDTVTSKGKYLSTRYCYGY